MAALPGLEAARAAAARGQRGDPLRGNGKPRRAVRRGGLSPYKGELASYVSWARNELDRLGVKVRFNTTFTAELAAKLAPDAITWPQARTPLF